MKIEITIPCYNEADILEKNALTLYNYCENNIIDEWKIIIADNGSFDDTFFIAKNLSQQCPKIKPVHFTEKGRGRTLKKVWLKSSADILIYMDADLATDLKSLNSLIEEIKNGNHLVTGSRYLKNSKIHRKNHRKLLSKLFIKLTNFYLHTNFSDFQCGFKAINQELNKKIISISEIADWCFDTEIMALANNKKFKIKEIPIVWQESEKSSIKIIRDIISSLFSLTKIKQKYAK
jgi:glycosyltransferase involved in cell wall biosynthesis